MVGFAGPGPRDSPELGISTRLHRPPCCQGSRWLSEAVFQVKPPWLCVRRGSRLIYRTGSGNSGSSRVSPRLSPSSWFASSASAVPRFPGTSRQHSPRFKIQLLSFRFASSVFGSRPQTSFALSTPVPGLRQHDETWQDKAYSKRLSRFLCPRPYGKIYATKRCLQS